MDTLMAEPGVGTRKSGTPLHAAKTSQFEHNEPILIEDAQVERLSGFVRPQGEISLSSEGPFDFVLQPAGDTYLNLGTLSIYAKLKIVQADGTNLPAGAEVAPINAIAVTMWDSVETVINDTVHSGATGSGTNYKSYIETILSYDSEMKDSHLACQRMIMDTPGKYDTMDDNNKGFQARKALVAGSKSFDTYAPVCSDFLRASNHLCPGNKLSLKLYRARDSFIINKAAAQDGTFKLKIEELKLYYSRIRLKDNLPPPAIERYLFTRTELKKFPIPAGLTTYNIAIQSGGCLPKSIVMAQVRTSAVEGNYSQNPLNFQHFNLCEARLMVNGRSYPSDGLHPDFDTNTPLLAREYAHMFLNTGTYRTDRANLISMEQFKAGCSIIPWDLSPDQCNGYHLHSAQTGVIGLELHWSVALPYGITVLIHTSHDVSYSKPLGHADFDIEYL